MDCLLISRSNNLENRSSNILLIQNKISKYFKNIYIQDNLFLDNSINKNNLLKFDINDCDKNSDWLTIIYDDQCFLDSKIVSLGLKKIKKIDNDIYSQELHVTLPLGIGMTN